MSKCYCLARHLYKSPRCVGRRVAFGGLATMSRPPTSHLDLAFSAAFRGTDLPGGRFWRASQSCDIFFWPDLAAVIVQAARAYFEGKERLGSLQVAEDITAHDPRIAPAAKRAVAAAVGLWTALSELVGGPNGELESKVWGKQIPRAAAWEIRDVPKVPVIGPDILSFFSAAVELPVLYIRARGGAHSRSAHWNNQSSAPAAGLAAIRIGMEMVRSLLVIALPLSNFTLPEDLPEGSQNSIRAFVAHLMNCVATDKIMSPDVRVPVEESFYGHCLREMIMCERAFCYPCNPPPKW
ncbi:protein SORF3 [Gallid alphaherpesvirus 1]|uniref:Protein SORF3 n=1 Tax=Infectious laryngotracheitis virus TaxID=10386 RepID=A0A0K0K744_ILTV|nr:protein SORF3 [Gallid alphaherpesvirus 1]AGN48309.1 protein SORF3 [Gallid alphaherpesvirus 1]